MIKIFHCYYVTRAYKLTVFYNKLLRIKIKFIYFAIYLKCLNVYNYILWTKSLFFILLILLNVYSDRSIKNKCMQYTFYLHIFQIVLLCWSYLNIFGYKVNIPRCIFTNFKIQLILISIYIEPILSYINLGFFCFYFLS